MEPTSFITVLTNGNAVLQSTSAADLFMDVLMGYRYQRVFLLHEFVVVPNGFHALVTPASRQSIERVVHFIKAGFSFRLKSTAPIWQPHFVNRRICDEEDFIRHCDYIWQSPVRLELVRKPEEYMFSSASGLYAVDPPPVGLMPRLDFVTRQLSRAT